MFISWPIGMPACSPAGIAIPEWSVAGMDVLSLVCGPLPDDGVEPAGRGCAGIIGWDCTGVCAKRGAVSNSAAQPTKIQRDPSRREQGKKLMESRPYMGALAAVAWCSRRTEDTERMRCGWFHTA